MKNKSWSVFKVIKQSSWCSDQQIYSFLELLGLGAALCSTDDDAVCLIVVLEQITSPFVVLHGQFSCRGNDQYTSPILGLEMHFTQKLDSRHHVGQRLTRACLGCSKHITTIKDVRNCSSLDFRASRVP